MRKIVSAGKVIDEGKTRKAKVRFGKLDNFDVGVIRRIIHNLYRENISPSLKKILLQLKEKMNFPYGKTHLWRLLSLVSIKPITTTTTTNFESKQSDQCEG